ncbi:hypothetical protein TrCOL_g10543 [Triparma columacea]|nr:hypothetical protein TrCOL_g10543 [Triparma columacea]
MQTDDFRRLFVEFLGYGWVDTLVTMRQLDKKWLKVVNKRLKELRISFDVYGECQGNCGIEISNREAKSPCDFPGCEHYVGYCFICVADCGGMDDLHQCTKTTCDNFENYYCEEHIGFGMVDDDGCSDGCFDYDDEDGYDY